MQINYSPWKIAYCVLIRYTVATVTGVHVKCNAISFRIGAYTCIRTTKCLALCWHVIRVRMQCILFHSFPFFWFLSLFVITRAPALSYVWGIEWKKTNEFCIKIDLSVVKVNGWTEWGNHITLLNGDNFLNFYCIRTQIKWHWMQWHWLQTYGLAIIGQTYKHPRFVDCHIMWWLLNVWCIFE